MKRTFFTTLISIAAIFGMIGVSFGAFGAHFLKSRLDVTALDALKTGVLYLFIHVLATLVVTILSLSHPASRLIRSAGVLFLLGVFLFSGSLFIISTSDLTGFPARYVGFITPLGGLCFICGWVALLLFALSGRNDRSL
jgi:uncharacterized membrane protein YgdD (TMEM256/DUF423 family)